MASVYIYGEAKSSCLHGRQKWLLPSILGAVTVQHKLYLTASYMPRKVNVKEKVLKRRMPLIHFSFIRWTCWQGLTVQLNQSLHVFHVCLSFKELFKNWSIWCFIWTLKSSHCVQHVIFLTWLLKLSSKEGGKSPDVYCSNGKSFRKFCGCFCGFF